MTEDEKLAAAVYSAINALNVALMDARLAGLRVTGMQLCYDTDGDHLLESRHVMVSRYTEFPNAEG